MPAMRTAAHQLGLGASNEQSPIRNGVIRSTPDFGAGVSGCLVAVAWKRITDATDISFAHTLLRNVYASRSRPLVFLQFVAPTAKPPASREREAVATLLAESAGMLSHSATVYIGQGFRAAMVRSIVTGINALARHTYPIRIFTTLPEAATWIEQNRSDLPIKITTGLVEEIMRADVTE